MKNIAYLGMLMMGLILSGCSGAFWSGAGGGTLATGAGYEVNSKMQMDRLKKELADGKITQAEYDIRADQVKRGSIVY